MCIWRKGRRCYAAPSLLGPHRTPWCNVPLSSGQPHICSAYSASRRAALWRRRRFTVNSTQRGLNSYHCRRSFRARTDAVAFVRFNLRGEQLLLSPVGLHLFPLLNNAGSAAWLQRARTILPAPSFSLLANLPPLHHLPRRRRLPHNALYYASPLPAAASAHLFFIWLGSGHLPIYPHCAALAPTKLRLRTAPPNVQLPRAFSPPHTPTPTFTRTRAPRTLHALRRRYAAPCGTVRCTSPCAAFWLINFPCRALPAWEPYRDIGLHAFTLTFAFSS